MYYFLYTTEKYYSAHFLNITDLDKSFDDRGMIRKNLEFPTVKYLRGKRKKGKGEYLRLNGKLHLFNDYIAENIYDKISEDAHFTRVQVEGDVWNLLNYNKVIDCFDKKKSEFILSESGNRYIILNKIVLKKELIRDHFCFLIPEMADGPLFFTEKFKLLIENYSHEGMDFVFADHL